MFTDKERERLKKIIVQEEKRALKEYKQELINHLKNREYDIKFNLKYGEDWDGDIDVEALSKMDYKLKGEDFRKCVSGLIHASIRLYNRYTNIYVVGCDSYEYLMRDVLLDGLDNEENRLNHIVKCIEAQINAPIRNENEKEEFRINMEMYKEIDWNVRNGHKLKLKAELSRKVIQECWVLHGKRRLPIPKNEMLYWEPLDLDKLEKEEKRKKFEILNQDVVNEYLELINEGEDKKVSGEICGLLAVFYDKNDYEIIIDLLIANGVVSEFNNRYNVNTLENGIRPIKLIAVLGYILSSRGYLNVVKDIDIINALENTFNIKIGKQNYSNAKKDIISKSEIAQDYISVFHFIANKA
ncbi:hypothetical protein [Mangrovimonas aestuarii]|uniref:hypothetical protein n=1 Tax=Mangrovimonas aestuarii TaxID=3018443 RepID=UPI0023783CA2|nr:hypothetical protein [Mangrovimonas aestuarii]